MQNEKVYQKYLFPVMLQIILVCLVVFFHQKNDLVCGYDSYLGMALIVVAGISSAMWGCIYQVKCCGKKLFEIFVDFFSVKASLKSYCLVAVFLFLDFSSVMVGGILLAQKPHILILLFAKAIVFGGIEEIGWRYTFQPVLEKRWPYGIAALITFICWGIWHFLFFYVDGSITTVEVIPFAIGLLTNCFILSAIFRFSNSLWLCVMTHALINALSQVTIGGNLFTDVFAKMLIIIVSILLSSRERNNA